MRAIPNIFIFLYTCLIKRLKHVAPFIKVNTYTVTVYPIRNQAWDPN